jgi:hypothetical protein
VDESVTFSLVYVGIDVAEERWEALQEALQEA